VPRATSWPTARPPWPRVRGHAWSRIAASRAPETAVAVGAMAATAVPASTAGSKRKLNAGIATALATGATSEMRPNEAASTGVSSAVIDSCDFRESLRLAPPTGLPASPGRRGRRSRRTSSQNPAEVTGNRVRGDQTTAAMASTCGKRPGTSKPARALRGRRLSRACAAPGERRPKATHRPAVTPTTITFSMATRDGQAGEPRNPPREPQQAEHRQRATRDVQARDCDEVRDACDANASHRRSGCCRARPPPRPCSTRADGPGRHRTEMAPAMRSRRRSIGRRSGDRQSPALPRRATIPVASMRSRRAPSHDPAPGIREAMPAAKSRDRRQHSPGEGFCPASYHESRRRLGQGPARTTRSSRGRSRSGLPAQVRARTRGR
jgi:hypothetical protein